MIVSKAEKALLLPSLNGQCDQFTFGLSGFDSCWDLFSRWWQQQEWHPSVQSELFRCSQTIPPLQVCNSLINRMNDTVVWCWFGTWCEYSEMHQHMFKKIKKSTLRWFGHVERKDDNDWVKRCITWEVEGTRQRGCLKKRPGGIVLRMTWEV